MGSNMIVTFLGISKCWKNIGHGATYLLQKFFIKVKENQKSLKNNIMFCQSDNLKFCWGMVTSNFLIFRNLTFWDFEILRLWTVENLGFRMFYCQHFIFETLETWEQYVVKLWNSELLKFWGPWTASRHPFNRKRGGGGALVNQHQRLSKIVHRM